MTNPIKLVAADDHRIFLEGLKSLFKLNPHLNLVAACEDGNSLLRLIAQYKPDIALIDISMPGTSTEEIVKTIEEQYPATRLIAVTMHLDPILAERLFKLGLCGYVLKEEAFDELNKAIQAVTASEQYISPSLLTAIKIYHQKENNNRTILTNREVDVLNHAAKGKTNKEIARALDISERTARFHISNCCVKLDAHGRSNAVAKALKMNLISI